MGGYVLEIWQAIRRTGHALPIVPNCKILPAMLAAPRDSDGFRVRVETVLDEFGDGLEWIALRKRDNADGVPIVADAQLASFGGVVGCICFRHNKKAAKAPARKVVLTRGLL